MVRVAWARKNKPKRRISIFNIINMSLMVLLIILMIYPFWFVLMYSFSEPLKTAGASLFLWPEGFTLSSYNAVFGNRSIMDGFRVSLIVTVTGVLLGVFITAITAYPLAKKRLKGRRGFFFYVLFTMLFSGGIVPTYILVKNLRLLDSLWALILPNILHAWNVIVMTRFFAAIPDSLEESPKMDGANDLLIFFRIIVPLSKPVLVTIGLFLAVGYWNDFFSTVLYIITKSKWSLQAVLRQIITTSANAMMAAGVTVQHNASISAKTIQMAAIIISTLPILIVYPFAQRHFVKGAMIGSVKG